MDRVATKGKRLPSGHPANVLLPLHSSLNGKPEYLFQLAGFQNSGDFVEEHPFRPPSCLYPFQNGRGTPDGHGPERFFPIYWASKSQGTAQEVTADTGATVEQLRFCYWDGRTSMPWVKVRICRCWGLHANAERPETIRNRCCTQRPESVDDDRETGRISVLRYLALLGLF